MKKIVSLKINEIFDLNINTNSSKFTKSFIQKNKGTIPVYSASKDPELISYGFVKDNLSEVKYFENCLTWNIDGSIGKAFFRNGRFTLSEKVIPLILRKEYLGKIDYQYVKYELEKEAVKRGFSFSNKAGKTKIEDIEIIFPAKDVDGKLVVDISLQKKTAERYVGLDLIKTKFNLLKKSLENTKIVLSESDIGKFKLLPLGSKGDFFVDNGDRVTKEQISIAKGEIPLYSSSKYRNEVLGRVSDKIKEIVPTAKKFNGKCITINADATDYRAFFRDEEFYANDVCNVIKILNKKIDYSYLQFELIAQISTMGLYWGNKLYKDKLRQIEVRIPINSTGEFDLEKQIKIAKKYRFAEETKEILINELNQLINSKIEIPENEL